VRSVCWGGSGGRPHCHLVLEYVLADIHLGVKMTVHISDDPVPRPVFMNPFYIHLGAVHMMLYNYSEGDRILDNYLFKESIPSWNIMQVIIVLNLLPLSSSLLLGAQIFRKIWITVIRKQIKITIQREIWAILHDLRWPWLNHQNIIIEKTCLTIKQVRI
jgi:hypothetical protein